MLWTCPIISYVNDTVTQIKYDIKLFYQKVTADPKTYKTQINQDPINFA